MASRRAPIPSLQLHPSLNQGQPPILRVAGLGLLQTGEGGVEVAACFLEQRELRVGPGDQG